MLIVSTEKDLYTHYVPFKIANFPIQDVTSIQADGNELDVIRSTFERLSIPDTGKHVVRWYGDIAKTIYANLFI